MTELFKVPEVVALRIGKLVAERDGLVKDANLMQSQIQQLGAAIQAKVAAANALGERANEEMRKAGLDSDVYMVHVDEDRLLPSGQALVYCGVYTREGAKPVDKDLRPIETPSSPNVAAIPKNRAARRAHRRSRS